MSLCTGIVGYSTLTCTPKDHTTICSVEHAVRCGPSVQVPSDERRQWAAVLVVVLCTPEEMKYLRQVASDVQVTGGTWQPVSVGLMPVRCT